MVPMPMLGEYATAKYGIVGLAEVLRRELEGTGVGVTVIMPGLTLSNMTTEFGMDARFVGEAIVRGIEADQPYVFTHPWVRDALERRFAAMIAGIGEPADPDFVLTKTQWESASERLDQRARIEFPAALVVARPATGSP